MKIAEGTEQITSGPLYLCERFDPGPRLPESKRCPNLIFIVAN